MKLHANARSCPNSRRVMVRRFLDGRSREILSAEFAVSTRTVSKWVARYRAEGEDGLADRPSAARCVPHRTPEDRVEAIAGAAQVADDRRGDRRVSEHAALEGVSGVGP